MFVGADVDQLRALAAQFDQEARRFSAIAVESSLSIMVAQWTGAKIDRLRNDWNRQSKPSLQRIAHKLQSLARELRAEAEAQERASAGTTGVTARPGSRHGVPPFDQPRTGPGDLRGAIDGIKGFGGGDLFSVTEVVGPDGKTRLIVTIPGTHGDITDPLGVGGKGSWWQTGGWASDPAVWLDQNSDIREQIMAALKERVEAYPGAEIMVVGHSQGGMLAQVLANSNEFNITEVVTVGSPRMSTDNGFGGANVTRLAHNSDIIVGVTDLAAIVRDQLTGHSQPYQGPGGSDVTFKGGSYLEGLGAHDVGIGDYDWLADRFEESDDPHVVDARERQEAFLGGSMIGTGYVPVPGS